MEFTVLFSSTIHFVSIAWFIIWFFIYLFFLFCSCRTSSNSTTQMSSLRYPKERCKHKKCEKKTIIISETSLNSRRLFYCCPDHGHSHWCESNEDGQNFSYSNSESISKHEESEAKSISKNQVEVKNYNTRGEGGIVQKLIVLNLAIFVVYIMLCKTFV